MDPNLAEIAIQEPCFAAPSVNAPGKEPGPCEDPPACMFPGAVNLEVGLSGPEESQPILLGFFSFSSPWTSLKVHGNTSGISDHYHCCGAVVPATPVRSWPGRPILGAEDTSGIQLEMMFVELFQDSCGILGAQNTPAAAATAAHSISHRPMLILCDTRVDVCAE